MKVKKEQQGYNSFSRLSLLCKITSSARPSAQWMGKKVEREFSINILEKFLFCQLIYKRREFSPWRFR